MPKVDVCEAMRMVKYFARKYRRSALGYDDAVGVGNLALVEAAISYDPSRGVPFGGYAAPRVRGAMTDAQRKVRGSRFYPSVETVLPEAFWDEEQTSDESCEGWDLFAAVKSLTPGDREVCEMMMGGEKMQDIAKSLGVSPSRISQRVRRIKMTLRIERE